MNAKTKYWNTLELPAILARLAEYTSFSAGKEQALALEPAFELPEVCYRQEETAEARKLLAVKPDLRLGGVHDLRPFVDNAARGARLLPQDLLNVRDTLRQAHKLRGSMLRLEETFPHMAAIARRLEPCPELTAEIERCIADSGEVLDRASPALARIRGELRVAHDRLMDKLNRMLASAEYSAHLQEAYVTQRDGRYVIPIRAEAKTRIPGLVHDRSASGATLFVEPMATIELNNQWRELQLEEQQEVERILLALAGRVAERGEEIWRTVEALADLDLALAKAKYADGTRATMPEILPFVPCWGRKRQGRRRLLHPGSIIDLRQARHPLLDPKTVVPIDVRLRDQHFIVVITGPNTGGKTVSLKTVGLLALMAQCGLHLPVEEGSALTVFEHICADIGDEQSIEQSLSTFSSHMSHIIDILELAHDHSLVLLDELGAGTDPLEGAALAQALLLELRGRHVTTLATTHYPELKVFAEETRGVVNASVEFDLETLSPTYHLTMGLPGGSNAFAIAERLGLPNRIVRRAQERVSSSHLDAERFLTQIKETQSQTEQAQAEAQAARADARQTSEKLRARLAGIEQERQAVLRQAREQAAGQLEEMNKELRTLRRRLDVMAATPSALREVEQELETLEDRLVPVEPLPGEPLLPQEAGDAAEAPIEVGDTVWVADLNATGEVIDLDGQAAEVQVGSFRVRTRLASLELRRKASSQPQADSAMQTPQVTVPQAPPISLELHLRGMRVQEALPVLEKYLDDAYRSQAPFVRIVHGKGTGTLRKVVREVLQRHPQVSLYREGEIGEGDAGVTIVKFADR